MTLRRIFLYLCLGVLTASPPVTAQETRSKIAEDVLQQRRAIAEQGTYLYRPLVTPLAAAAPVAGSFGDALDIPPSFVVNASVSGPAAAAGIFPGLGVIKPRRGATFVVLSTGIAGTAAPEPGTDFSPEGISGDRVALTLVLNLPQGVNRLSFDFNFLSAEYPDFIGSAYNDTFSAVLTDSSGVREIARSSVNSAAFFPASASTAGGSGFDIFTPDPSGVDSQFGLGLPDAGLTGFQSVNVTVTGGGLVTLEFSIEDLGDGILDSAVILDNLVVSSLEVVDPNPVLLSGGKIIANPTILAHGGNAVQGAAADGITRVLLRSRVPGAGVMEFCLVGASAPGDGGLAQVLVPDSGRADCVNTPAVNTADGYMAFAAYRTPDAFNRGGDEASVERSFQFKARFTPAAGSVTESNVPFRLVRPPLVLVHGLWSDSGTWTFPLVNDARFSVTLADYKGTNASHFSTNLLIPFSYIREALTRERLNGIAVTQVDIAGHSMGGILSRNHASIATYKRNDNFNAGDLHTLVTLNTPHTGSPLGNLIQGIRAVPLLGGLFEEAMANIEHPVDEGATEDLAKGSPAINSIQSTPVPSHALVGIGGSDALALLPGRIGTIYKVVNFFADTSTLFQGLQHDGIVGRQSQEGGLPYGITVFGGLDSIHIFVTGNAFYSTRLVELLNSSPAGSSFAFFPAPASLSSMSALHGPDAASPVVTRGSVPLSQVAVNPGLTITSPADGTQVTPGNIVHVVVAAGVGVVVDRVLLTGPGAALVDDTAPFEFDLVIPAEAAGDFTLLAVGSSGNQNFFYSNPITLHALPAAALNSITLLPRDPILFAIGESRTMTTLGQFADGITRDISSPGAGTTYLTSSPGIVAVSPSGVVTAVNVGRATIVAQNGSLQQSLSVTVVSANLIPIANAGTDQQVPVGSLVTLNGTQSFDPDAGPEPLSFLWTQVAGPAVTLQGGTTASATFTPFIAGTYTFSLVVSDGPADSAPASVRVGVGTPVVLQGAASRKVHGAVGTFNHALALTPANPTTEPRSGGAGGNHTIAFAFNQAVTGGTAAVTEGTATAGAPVFIGNEMIVPLTGVANAQYVTVTVSNVASAGSSDGGGSVRIGFLLGDVNGNRVVTLSDMLPVNAALSQGLSGANFLRDVNASGTFSLADLLLINANLTKALPAP